MKKLIILAAAAVSFGCQDSGFNCVAKGTRVLTPKGWRRIEDLVVGDIVYAVSEATGERVETPVTAIRSATREVGSIQFSDASLRLTTDHPVYCPVEGVYAPAGDWFLGKRDTVAVLSDHGLVDLKVDAIQTYVGVDQVFDITVEHALHNFVAEGVLVHNKSQVDTREPCTCPDGSESVTYFKSDTCDCPEQPGNCSSADDCPGGTCVSAAPDLEYQTCQVPFSEPSESEHDMNECNAHSDCSASPGGKCVAFTYRYCGGPQPTEHNECRYDGCQEAADCADEQVCIGAGTFGEPVSTCVIAKCKAAADCDGAGAACQPFFNGCGNQLVGFHCVNNDSACRVNTDCEPGWLCVPGDDGPRCEEDLARP